MAQTRKAGLRVYLLDTNVVSELRRNKPHGAVVQWLNAQQNENLFLAAITLGEIQAGIENLRTSDVTKADELENWLEDVEASYALLPITSPVARCWAKIKHGHPATLNDDAMLAATAIVHGLTVVTRNAKDFQHFPVNTTNPFDYRG